MLPFSIAEHLKSHPKDVRKATVIALIFKRSTLLSIGYNRRKMSQHSRGGYIFTFHAEYSALLKAGTRARGSDMYVIRVRKDGTIGVAKPCAICESHIRRARIARVIDVYDVIS